MLFYWPKLLYPYYSPLLFFTFSSFCRRLVLWGGGLRTNRVYITLSHPLELPTSFDNNNDNNNNNNNNNTEVTVSGAYSTYSIGVGAASQRETGDKWGKVYVYLRYVFNYLSLPDQASGIRFEKEIYILTNVSYS